MSPTQYNGQIYDHLIAMKALIEATRLSDQLLDKTRVAAISEAIEYVQDSRNPYMAWRYGFRDGKNDSSVTAWAVFALTAARRAGLKVDPKTLQYALAYYESVTDPATGICGYTKMGEQNSRHEEMRAEFPPKKSAALTAQALLARFHLGEKAMQEPLRKVIVRHILTLPPIWNESDGSIDFYYWFHATDAMSIVGGQSWKIWRKALNLCLAKGQLWDGSWKLAGPWCADGGPVYTTAISTICLLTAEGRNSLDFIR